MSRFWCSFTLIAVIWAIGSVALTESVLAPSYAQMISRTTATQRVDPGTGLIIRLYHTENQLRKNERAFGDVAVLFFLISGGVAFGIRSLFFNRIKRADREEERRKELQAAQQPSNG